MAVAEVHLLEAGRALGGVALGHLDLHALERRVLLVGALALLHQQLLEAAHMGLVVVGLLLLALEALLARVQLLEVDRMAVEIGPVDAGELDFAADRHAARAAHAGAVDHDRVQRHHGAHAERARGLGAGVHHRHRADRHHQLRPARSPARRASAASTKPGRPALPSSVHTISSSLNSPSLSVQNMQLGVAEADDAGDAVAGLLEGAQLRKDRRHAQAAADQHHVADLLDVLRQPERPDEVGEFVALGEIVAHLAGGLAQRLHHDRDGAALAVEVGDGERNALAGLVQPQHDEMAGLRGLRDVRRIDFPQEGLLGELFASNDADHRALLRACGRAALRRRPVRAAAAASARSPPGAGSSTA